MARVVVFLGAARHRAMRVGRANKTHLKRVHTVALAQLQTGFQCISDHIAWRIVLKRNGCCALGLNFTVDTAQHTQVIRRGLFKVAQFIFG